MIYQVLYILFSCIFIYLAFNTLYLLFLAIAGHFSNSHTTTTSEKKRFAILITSYKEDDVIVRTVSSAAAHDYPSSLFDVYVAADHLQHETILKMSQYRAGIYEVNFPVGSKARSLNFLLNIVDASKYDYALVLDGDNIMSPGFLQKMNSVIGSNNVAVQAHRTAKNMNTPVATLDAISEEVNNHLFRKAPSVLGISSSLIGSGMAFPFQVLKEIYNKPGILDNPACDREVDFEMLVKEIKIKYIPDAVLLDEKVAGKIVYTNQRRRWVESQLTHISLFFSDWKRVAVKSVDFWHKLFIQLMPPRMLMLAAFIVLLLLIGTGLLFNLQLSSIAFGYWIFLFIAYLCSLVLAIPRSFFNSNTIAALAHLPMLLFFLSASGFYSPI